MYKGGCDMPRNKYPEETRQKIIEAGIKTFQEKGYEQSTILDIVANMEGLTRGAFYHHFKSKEEVLNAITDKIFYEKNPFELVRKEKGLNGLQKLQKTIKMNVDDIDDEYRLLRIASLSLLESPQFFTQQIHFNTVLSRKYIQPLIEEGVADGSIKTENPQLVAELTIMLFNFWLLPVVFGGDAEYMESKAVLANDILTYLGLPLFDDEMAKYGEKFINVLADEHNKNFCP